MIHKGWVVDPNHSIASNTDAMYTQEREESKELRTVFDLREQNANTHKDLTPMPDQDAIRHAVAKARYRSKCDISNAYELIRVEPGDV